MHPKVENVKIVINPGMPGPFSGKPGFDFFEQGGLLIYKMKWRMRTWSLWMEHGKKTSAAGKT